MENPVVSFANRLSSSMAKDGRTGVGLLAVTLDLSRYTSGNGDH